MSSIPGFCPDYHCRSCLQAPEILLLRSNELTRRNPKSVKYTTQMSGPWVWAIPDNNLKAMALDPRTQCKLALPHRPTLWPTMFQSTSTFPRASNATAAPGVQPKTVNHPKCDLPTNRSYHKVLHQMPTKIRMLNSLLSNE
jgi:hypothetical protein